MKITYESNGVWFMRNDGTPMPLQDGEDICLTLFMFFIACVTIGVNLFIDESYNGGVWVHSLLLVYICFYVRSKAIQWNKGFLPYDVLQHFSTLSKLYTCSYFLNFVVALCLKQKVWWSVVAGIPLHMALSCSNHINHILQKQHKT